MFFDLKFSSQIRLLLIDKILSLVTSFSFYKFKKERLLDLSLFYLEGEVPQVQLGPHKQIVQSQFDLSLFV